MSNNSDNAQQPNEDVNPMDMPIIDRGVMFVKNPVERVKHTRMTKKELHEFVRWTFTHKNDDNWDSLSGLKIANLYFQETGKYINRATVNRNRDNWFLKGGKIVRNDGVGE